MTRLLTYAALLLGGVAWFITFQAVLTRINDFFHKHYLKSYKKGAKGNLWSLLDTYPANIVVTLLILGSMVLFVVLVLNGVIHATESNLY